jgi:hypothetical protein
MAVPGVANGCHGTAWFVGAGVVNLEVENSFTACPYAPLTCCRTRRIGLPPSSFHSVLVSARPIMVQPRLWMILKPSPFSICYLFFHRIPRTFWNTYRIVLYESDRGVSLGIWPHLPKGGV